MNARHFERGSTMVEFAIVAAILLAVIFGIMEFGRALYIYHLVDNGARIGARYAIVRGSACTVAGCPASASAIQSYVQSVSPVGDGTSLTVTTAWSSSGSCTTPPGPGCLVAVTASYPFGFSMPFMPSGGISISSTSTMVISQ